MEMKRKWQCLMNTSTWMRLGLKIVVFAAGGHRLIVSFASGEKFVRFEIKPAEWGRSWSWYGAYPQFFTGDKPPFTFRKTNYHCHFAFIKGHCWVGKFFVFLTDFGFTFVTDWIMFKGFRPQMTSACFVQLRFSIYPFCVPSMACDSLSSFCDDCVNDVPDRG